MDATMVRFKFYGTIDSHYHSGFRWCVSNMCCIVSKTYGRSQRWAEGRILQVSFISSNGFYYVHKIFRLKVASESTEHQQTNQININFSLVSFLVLNHLFVDDFLVFLFFGFLIVCADVLGWFYIGVFSIFYVFPFSHKYHFHHFHENVNHPKN